MATNVKTLTLDHTMQDCINFMKSNKIRHAPIVDFPGENETQPYFVGVVSERDVLRVLHPDAKVLGRENIDLRALRQRLVQIVTRKPVSVLPTTPVPQVIMALLDNHIDMVPVLDGTDLTGIITTTDIIKLFFSLDQTIRNIYPHLKSKTDPVESSPAGSSHFQTLSEWVFKTVREVMTEQVISLAPKDNLGTAIVLLQQERFRHIPIVNEQLKLVGIVSDRDILRYLPFAGMRLRKPAKTFREHLFRIYPEFVNLQLPLERIMTRKVTHVSPDCTVYDAADILCRMKVSCLPVLDEEKILRGILTVTDLMRALLVAYAPAQKCHA
jgi:CBS domain-containing protein